MSFEAMSRLLEAENERKKRELENDRIQWFYTLIAPGLSKVEKPQDIVTFDWEKKEKKHGKRLTKEQLKEQETKANKWLKNKLP